MRIAILDDEKQFAINLQEKIRAIQEQIEEPLETEVFVNAEPLLKKIQMGQLYSIYLLDVELGGENGIKVMKKIRQMDKHAAVAFISSYESYRISGMEAGAYKYILKSKLDKELSCMLIKFYENERRKTLCIFVKSGSCVRKIWMKDILYIERVGKNIVYHCVDGDCKERNSLSNVFQKLDENGFAYINSSEIVNIAQVSAINNEVIVLENNMQLYASRRMCGNFCRRIMQYWGNA